MQPKKTAMCKRLLNEWEAQKKELQDFSVALKTEKLKTTLVGNLWEQAIPMIDREINRHIFINIIDHLDIEKMGVAQYRLDYANKEMIKALRAKDAFNRMEKDGEITTAIVEKAIRNLGDDPDREDVIKSIISIMLFYELSRELNIIIYTTIMSKLRIVLQSIVKRMVKDGLNSKTVKDILTVEYIEKNISLDSILEEARLIAVQETIAQTTASRAVLSDTKYIELFDRKLGKSKELWEEERGLVFQFAKKIECDKKIVNELYQCLDADRRYSDAIRQIAHTVAGTTREIGEIVKNTVKMMIDLHQDYVIWYLGEKVKVIINNIEISEEKQSLQRFKKNKTTSTRKQPKKETTKNTKPQTQTQAQTENKDIEKTEEREDKDKAKSRNIFSPTPKTDKGFDASKVTLNNIKRIGCDEEEYEFQIVFTKGGFGKAKEEQVIAKVQKNGVVNFAPNIKNLDKIVEVGIRKEAEKIIRKKKKNIQEAERLDRVSAEKKKKNETTSRKREQPTLPL